MAILKNNKCQTDTFVKKINCCATEIFFHDFLSFNFILCFFEQKLQEESFITKIKTVNFYSQYGTLGLGMPIEIDKAGDSKTSGETWCRECRTTRAGTLRLSGNIL